MILFSDRIFAQYHHLFLDRGTTAYGSAYGRTNTSNKQDVLKNKTISHKNRTCKLAITLMKNLATSAQLPRSQVGHQQTAKTDSHEINFILPSWLMMSYWKKLNNFECQWKLHLFGRRAGITTLPRTPSHLICTSTLNNLQYCFRNKIVNYWSYFQAN